MQQQQHEATTRDACAICGERFEPRDERAVDAIGNTVHRQCLDDVLEPTD